MVYTPRLSLKASASVKSLSYTLGLPMTKTIEKAIELLPLVIHPVLVCQKCRDQSRCAVCVFNKTNMSPDVEKLLSKKG
ncbi:MAG: hypothetical protein LBT95_10235 [Treponema sp.]|jgi:hypothetical protein|nr:hypothetical protein [Treponema sp.]